MNRVSISHLAWVFAVAGAVLLGQTSVATATTYYWDTNGTTAGAGTNSGTWDSNAYWSTDSSGNFSDFATAVTTTTADDDVVFCAGADVAARTVSLVSSGTTYANSITVDEGNVTFSVAGSVRYGSNTLVLGQNTDTNAGVIDVASGMTLAISGTGASFYHTIYIQGSHGLTKNDLGTLTMNSYVTLQYSGATTINAGTLTLGVASQLPTSTVLILGNAAGVYLNSTNYTQTVASLSGGGASGGTIAMGTGALTVGNMANTTYGGIITGTGAFTKQGTGSLTLWNANTYSGATTVTGGGTLALDFSQTGSPASNIVNNGASAAALTLSGTLSLNGSNSVANSQQFSALTLNFGGSNIKVTSNGANIYLNLGSSITRNTGATVALVLPSGTQNVSNGIRSTATLTNGILGAYATVGNSAGASDNWATTSGVNIVAYSGYSDLTVAGGVIANSSTTNYRFNGASGTYTLSAGTTTVNTLDQAFNSSGGAVTIDTTGKTLATGGVLQGSTAAALTIGTSANAGNLNNGTGELILTNNSTSNNLTIHSTINTGSVTTTGFGKVVLDGANSYANSTGTSIGATTTVNGGTLLLGGSHVYQGNIVINVGGTLSAGADNILPHGMLCYGSSHSYMGAVTINGTLDVNDHNLSINAFNGNAASVVTNNGTGTGILTVGMEDSGGTFTGVIKDGTGKVGLTESVENDGFNPSSGVNATVLAGANTYTGPTTITRGNLTLNFSAAGAPTSNIINNTSDSSTLVTHGGVLTLTGSTVSGVSNSQQFNGLTVGQGSSNIVLTQNSATALSLNLGAISRNTGGVLQFNPSSTTASTITTTTANDATGIIGGYLLYGDDWACNNGSGAITAYAGYTAVAASGVIADSYLGGSGTLANVSLTATSSNTVTLGASDVTVNTVLNKSGSTTINTTGSILRLGAVGGVYNAYNSGGAINTTIGATVNGGTLTAGGAPNAPGEVVLISDSASSGTLTVNSTIADNGTGPVALTIGGNVNNYGTVTLNGNNTYSGGTTIATGYVNLGSSNPFGTGAITIASTPVNTFLYGNTQLYLSTDVALPNNAWNWNADFAIINAHAFNMGTGAVTLGGDRTLLTSGTVTIGGAIGDGGKGYSIRFGGGGRWILNGASTYSGGTVIDGGTVQFSSINSFGTGPIWIVNTDGTLIWGAGCTDDISSRFDPAVTASTHNGSYYTTFDTNGNNVTLANPIGAGAGGIRKQGLGTLTLSAANYNTRGTSLYGGTLSIANANALGTAGLTIDASGVALDNGYGSALTLANNPTQTWSYDFTFLGTNDLNMGTGAVTLGSTRNVTVNASNLTVGGVISGASYGLVKTGLGTLTLGNAANTYGGGTTINTGTLEAMSSGSLPNFGTSGKLTVGGSGTLAIRTDGWTAGSITSLLANTTAWTSGSTIGLDTTGGNFTYGSNITNSGLAVTKLGANTLTLSGANTYTGATTVSAGTLFLTGSLAANDDVQVANGATYQVLVSSTTSLSLYSRLATTDPSANKLNLVGAVINQDANRTLDSQTVTMTWRARNNAEVALGLGSDVMTLGGITAATPYVVDMYYNPASLLGPGAPTLAYNPSDDTWLNAVNGNTGNNASGGERGYVGSFASFQASLGDTNIADYVGAYGYDPGTDQAWAVVNQAGGTFAVVPEPGTLAMLVVCLLGMAAYAWRKRK